MAAPARTTSSSKTDDPATPDIPLMRTRSPTLALCPTWHKLSILTSWPMVVFVKRPRSTQDCTPSSNRSPQTAAEADGVVGLGIIKAKALSPTTACSCNVPSRQLTIDPNGVTSQTSWAPMARAPTCDRFKNDPSAKHARAQPEQKGRYKHLGPHKHWGRHGRRMNTRAGTSSSETVRGSAAVVRPRPESNLAFCVTVGRQVLLSKHHDFMAEALATASHAVPGPQSHHPKWHAPEPPAPPIREGSPMTSA